MKVRLLLALYCALTALPLAAVAAVALCTGRGRSALKRRLCLDLPPPAGEREEVLWIHGASVGEILAAEGLVREFMRRRPSARLVMSTFTATGMNMARTRYGEAEGRISFTLLPADWCGIPGRVLDRCRPSLFVILETELWPVLYAALSSHGIPLALANGRISRKSFSRYRALTWFFRPFLETCALVCARTSADGDRFRLLGVPQERIVVAGNMKHDALREASHEEKAVAWRKLSDEEGKPGVLVAGSLRGREGEILLDAYSRLKESFSDLRLVLAPRHPGRFDEGLLERTPYTWVRWSEVGEGGQGGQGEVVLVDTMGDLAGLYAVADVAFVGGTIDGSQGHNLLEPALRGIPVLFGPGFTSFQEEGEALAASGGGFITENTETIVNTVRRLFENGDRRREAGKKAVETGRTFSGAVARTLAALEGLIPREGH